MNERTPQQEEKISFDHYWDLPLDIKGTTKRTDNGVYLEDMLKHFLREETILNGGHENDKMKIETEMWKLPKILVIMFKRFEAFYDGYRKLDTTVVFPKILEASKLFEGRGKTNFLLSGN